MGIAQSGCEIGWAFPIKYGQGKRATSNSAMMEIIPSKMLTYRSRAPNDAKKG